METDNKTLESFYKKCFTKYIITALKDKGFKRLKTNSVARITDDFILQIINFKKGPLKSRNINVNICVRPLYIPHEKLDLYPGRRLDWLIYDKSSWWSLRDESTIENSLIDISKNIEMHALPMFEKLKNTNQIISEFIDNTLNLNLADNVLLRDKDLGYMYMYVKEYDAAKECFEKGLNDIMYFTGSHNNINFSSIQNTFKSLINILNKNELEISKYLNKCINVSKQNLGVKE